MSIEQSVDVEALHRAVASIGSGMGTDVRDAVQALYGPLHPAEAPQRVVRDCAYGSHERHLVDLHLPLETPAEPLPVLLFVHGGGFVGGDKGGPGRPFYDNIGRFAVENGWIGATITYRLAPEHRFPSGAEDVAAAAEFLSATIAEHGGDPGRVVVMGHSAGAAHVATFAATPALRERVPGLRAVVLSSGIYEPSSLVGQRSTAYYGEDEAALASMGSVEGVAHCGVDVLVVVAELDPPDFHHQAARLISAYTATNDRMPAVAFGIGHNHFSSPAHYGSVDAELSEVVAAFIRSATGT